MRLIRVSGGTRLADRPAELRTRWRLGSNGPVRRRSRLVSLKRERLAAITFALTLRAPFEMSTLERAASLRRVLGFFGCRQPMNEHDNGAAAVFENDGLPRPSACIQRAWLAKPA